MAEFQEVMKQAKRMCEEHYECGDCPFRQKEDFCSRGMKKEE